MPKIPEYRKRRSIARLVVVLGVMCLAACATPPTESVVSPGRPSATNPVGTPSLSSESVATLQVTEMQEGRVSFDPTSIVPYSSTAMNLPGYLVFDGTDKQVLELSSMTSRMLGADEYPLAVSPDHERLAILEMSEDRQSEVLVIENALGDVQVARRLDRSLAASLDADWLDNQRIAMNVVDELGKPQPTYDIAIVNVDNGDISNLVSDYPGLTGMISGPAGTMHFGTRTVAYDPSLQFVLYPKSAASMGYSIVLWDRSRSVTLAEIKDKDGFGNAAIWSPNGSQVAIPVWQRSRQEASLLAEWFLINRDGNVQQLTTFVEQFDSVVIYQPSWSPDGTQIAFWLDAEPSQCPGISLAILTVQTHETRDYCIPRLINWYSGPPVWSPDGKGLAVASVNTNNERSVVVVSLLDNRAVRIANSGVPVGWMK